MAPLVVSNTCEQLFTHAGSSVRELSDGRSRSLRGGFPELYKPTTRPKQNFFLQQHIKHSESSTSTSSVTLASPTSTEQNANYTFPNRGLSLFPRSRHNSQSENIDQHEPQLWRQRAIQRAKGGMVGPVAPGARGWESPWSEYGYSWGFEYAFTVASGERSDRLVI